MAFVRFEDLRKVYQMGEVQVNALDGVDFSIEQGELTDRKSVV